MRILVFSDTHGDTDLSHLRAPAEKADFILCAGDITDWSEQLTEVLVAFQDFASGLGKEIVLTHGNHEGPGIAEAVAKHPNLRYVHQALYVQGEVAVAGYGGGGFAKQDREFERFARSVHQHKDMRGRLQVWLIHGPPHDLVVDTIPGWGATGCKSKRAMIEELSPHIVVSGHIHETAGIVHEHGKTLLVNPGPRGVLLEINEE